MSGSTMSVDVMYIRSHVVILFCGEFREQMLKHIASCVVSGRFALGRA